MSDNNDDATTVTVQLTGTTNDGRGKYASADEDTVCNGIIAFPEGREPDEFLSLIIGEDSPAKNLTLERTTKNYSVYESENGAVEGLYINRDVFEGEPPEEIGFSLEEATEEDFEEAVAEMEAEQSEEAEELFA